MTNNPRNFEACEEALQTAMRTSFRAKLAKRCTGATDEELGQMATNCRLWATDNYNAGFRELSHLRAMVKEECREEYGSILVAILFAVIWEIIKAWLFD